jgi:hypothetical protein
VGSTVTVWLDGTVAGKAAPDEAGSWSLTPTQALAEGSHLVVATAEDEAGNTSLPSAEYSFIIPRSHYGWSCTTAPTLSASWALWVLAMFLRRRASSRVTR